MDQIQTKSLNDWKELNQDKQIIAEDIIKQLQLIGPKAYHHQFEFLKYLLGQDIWDQLPLIALKSQTGSGKTLCFQAIIYQNYDSKIHSKASELKYFKGAEKRVLTPYSIVLGNTIFLKQHEEVFLKYMPERLKNEGLKFQTFYALGKGQGEKQFDTPENRIENAEAQVLLCHPSKIMAAIKTGVFNCKNLRYLIIDEADDLLKDDPANMARRDIKDILSFMMGQRGENLKFQIIFVSASLKPEQIQDIVQDSILKNLENDKPVDKRFFKFVDDKKVPLVDIKILPSDHSTMIAPYQIRHFYYEAKEKKMRKSFLVQLIETIFLKIDQIQVMIFFNSKIGTKKLFNEMEKNPSLKFLVDKQQVIFCTGETNQIERENIRKDFKEQRKKILLCTDVLQRGLDFRKVRLIIHYGLPKDPASKFAQETYFQRSGRTGRAQDEGAVITLLAQKDKAERKKQMIDALTFQNCKIEEYHENSFLKDIETVLQFNQEEQA